MYTINLKDYKKDISSPLTSGYSKISHKPKEKHLPYQKGHKKHSKNCPVNEVEKQDEEGQTAKKFSNQTYNNVY